MSLTVADGRFARFKASVGDHRKDLADNWRRVRCSLSVLEFAIDLEERETNHIPLLTHLIRAANIQRPRS